MAEVVTSTVASKERERCARIVRAYRDDLLRAHHRMPDARNTKDVLTVIRRLEEMEAKIRCVPRENIPDISKERIVDGGFSMDELHMAGELIERLSANPFEE